MLWKMGSLLALFTLTLIIGNFFVPADKAVDRSMIGHDFLAFFSAGELARTGLYQRVWAVVESAVCGVGVCAIFGPAVSDGAARLGSAGSGDAAGVDRAPGADDSRAARLAELVAAGFACFGLQSGDGGIHTCAEYILDVADSDPDRHILACQESFYSGTRGRIAALQAATCGHHRGGAVFQPWVASADWIWNDCAGFGGDYHSHHAWSDR
jgi:hypothetical protein